MYNLSLFLNKPWFASQQFVGASLPVLSDPQRLELLKLLQASPQMSQRELAQAMGVSLGKANYCLNGLMEKGLVKLENFRKNPDKRQYAYLLTPAGLEEKTRITVSFLRRKVAEYKALEEEIVRLRDDLKSGDMQGHLPTTPASEKR